MANVRPSHEAVRPGSSSSPAAAGTATTIPRTPAPAPGRLSLTVPDAASSPTSPCTTPGTAVDAESDYDPASPHPLSAFYSHPATRTSLEQLRNASSVTVGHQHRHSPSRSVTRTHTRQSLGGQPQSQQPQQQQQQPPGSRDGGCCSKCATGDAGPDVDLEAGRAAPPAPPAACLAKGGACLVVVDATGHVEGMGSAGSSTLGLEKTGEAWPCRQTVRRRRLECQRGRRHRPFNRLSPRMRIVVKVLLALLVVGIATGLGVGISKALNVGVWKTENSQMAIGQ